MRMEGVLSERANRGSIFEQNYLNCQSISKVNVVLSQKQPQLQRGLPTKPLQHVPKLCSHVSPFSASMRLLWWLSLIGSLIWFKTFLFSLPCKTYHSVLFLSRRRNPETKKPPSSFIMMMNPSSYSSKTEQILSRYRPIAPKPPINSLLDGPTTPENTQQSPFFKHLQTRPTRSRKRGRYGCTPAKRTKMINHTLLSSPCGVASLAKNTQLGLSLQSFGHGFPPQFPHPSSGGLGASLEKSVNLVTLSFLPYPSFSSSEVPRLVSELPGMNACYSHLEEVMDLTMKADIPQEKDLLQTLQAADVVSDSGPANVITPRPVRPVGSSITLECIQVKPNPIPGTCASKKAHEVEAEIDAEALPVVVSDSSNRVRLANSAYKEMVGQPECLWLDSMVTYDVMLRGNACKRISGKVKLDLSDMQVPVSSNGFTCKVRIEWGSNENKSLADVPCDVQKLCCDSKDYIYKWRFHTTEKVSNSSFQV